MEWKNLARLAAISLSVCLLFRFILPWMFPFLAAVLIVQMVRKWLAVSRKMFHMKKIAALIVFCAGSTFLLLFSAYKLILCISEQGSRFFGMCRDSMSVWRDGLWGFMGDCETALGLPSGFLGNLLTERMDGMLAQARQYLMERLPDQVVRAAASCMGFFIAMTVVAIASLLLYQDYDGIVEELRRQKWYPSVERIRRRVSASGLAYLKTQGIILFCVTFCNAVGLYLLGYTNTLFFGILIGIIDFFPILGAGTILIPWMLILFLQGNYGTALGLGVIYLLCAFARQYLEPRLMGRQNGIRPFYMLICIYVGLRLFGIWGVFLGPLGVALIMGIYQEWKSLDKYGNSGV